METQKLEKSAIVTQAPFWQRNGLSILALVAMISLFANAMLYFWGSDVSRASIAYSRLFHEEAKRNDDLKVKNAQPLQDIEEMTSADAPQILFSPAVGDAYSRCMNHPVGLVFSPTRLGIESDRYEFEKRLEETPVTHHFRIHNPEVIDNRYRKFGYGDACVLDGVAMIRIAAVADGFYVLALEGQHGREYDTRYCPSSAIHLVASDNRVISKAVSSVCAIKALLSTLPDAPR